MPEPFLCVRCGYTEEEHEKNLVNEPAEGEFAHIETPAEGYAMSILVCMEADLPEDYKRRVQKLFLVGQRDRKRGYQSPNPEAEEAFIESRRIKRYGPQSFLVLPGGMGIIDLD